MNNCYKKAGILHFADTNTFLCKEGSLWYFILGDGSGKVHSFKEVIALRFDGNKNTIFAIVKNYSEDITTLTIIVPDGSPNYPLWDLFCWLKEHLTPKLVLKEDTLIRSQNEYT